VKKDNKTFFQELFISKKIQSGLIRICSGLADPKPIDPLGRELPTGGLADLVVDMWEGLLAVELLPELKNKKSHK